MPITRDLVLTVNNNTASLSEPVYLYRGDRGVELRIKVQQYKYKFNRRTVEDVMTNIYAARAIVHSTKRPEHDQPNQSDSEFCFEIKAVNVEDDIVVIPINRQWIDEVTEVGTYRIQIQLYGVDPVNERITIPPVEFFVEEVMCDIPDNTEDSFDNVNRTDETPTNPEYAPNAQGFDSSTKLYTPYKFFPGEVIRSVSLNSMEDALKYLTEEVKDQSERISEVNDKVDEANNMADQNYRLINDLSQELTGLEVKIIDNKDNADNKFNALNTSIQGLDTKFTKATSENSGRLNNLEFELYNQAEGDIPFLKEKVEVNAQNIITVQKNASKAAGDAESRAVKTSKEYTDTKITTEVANRNKRCDALQEAINNEVTRSTDTDKELGDAITSLIQNLGEEEKLRKSGDDALRDRIGSVESSVTNEVKNRNDADANLQSQINTEISDRTNADSALQASINEEITNRTNSDTAIYQAIESSNSNIAKNTTAIAKEISDREGAISLLDEKHTGLNNALRLEIDGNIKTAIDELETTIDNDIKTKLDELDKEIDTEIKTSIETLGNSVYTKEETDDKITWLQENIRGPQGTSILRYMGELNSVEELMNKPQIEGDSYIIGTTVYVCNGQDGPDPIWDPVELRGPQGFFYTPQITETVDEDGYKQMMLSWSNNAPDGLLANPETINVKGEPIKFVYGDEPEDKNNLWIVEAEEHDYTTKGYVDQSVEPLSNKIDEVESSLNELKGSGLLTSSSAKRVEFVTEFPQELEEDVLYILVEQIM